MKITIKTLDQKTREVDVTPEDTVSDLKLLLEKSTNIPAERQRLIYNARAIDDDRSLREFDGCTLHLVEKPKKRTSDSNTAKEGSKAATTSQISTVLDLEKRAESVQEHYNAAFKLLDSQFPIPVVRLDLLQS
ncbi:uncharacterized protein TRIADDRAFT_53340 [Trichoplax adhaerens]|uniref:Ubiquitin-like domain-containing protein n=1 Tax=Trichoplax adhaerens TaxID=10228 RepID=B3RNY8_TRIAD|nr:hypothetical protein TRIADDRAFT_53340 [Trichoplax adhaerens]EDV28097.1 hypothetical protein TRIADDRAFT_53340 [Trichoplax adhaerens]|eukprot:XP_002109931.1 hypothetical protein TRIADDRAFT_53340 [Trichoplax adhaerens]